MAGTLSAAGRRAISEAMKRRWRKHRRAKKAGATTNGHTTNSNGTGVTLTEEIRALARQKVAALVREAVEQELAAIR